MLYSIAFAALCGVAIGGPVVPADPAATVNPTCNHDNCLRAVIASNHQPYPSSASADCSSFFLSTVTPATVTSTDTVWTTFTAPDVTVSVISTDLETSTITDTELTSVTSTQTDLATSVATIVEVSTLTSTVPTIVATVTLAPRELAARQVTVSPFAVPTYASACSGTVRYSSACACIGIGQSVTTVDTPTAWVTVTSTVTTTPTDIVSSTTTTTFSPVSIFSTTETELATITSTVDASTTTETSTTTTLIVATTAQVPCPSPSSFYIQISGPSVPGIEYLKAPQGYPLVITAQTSSKSDAGVFHLTPKTNGKQYLQYGTSSNIAARDIIGNVYWTTPGLWLTDYLSCSAVGNKGPLTCGGDFGWCSNELTIGPFTCSKDVTLTAVPFCSS